MRRADLIHLAWETLTLHRLRTGLTLAAIAIGVMAVLMLTSLGDAAKAYVVREFAGVGSNLVIVIPGRIETTGMPIPGGGTRDLTLEDAAAIERQSPAIRRAAPMSLGSGPIAYGGRSRDIRVIGSTSIFIDVRKLALSTGQFLPPGDPHVGDRVVVLGEKVARELFQGENPLGKLVRIGDWRLRVIGVLAPKGISIGIDYDDLVIVPVSVGLKMFDQSSLFRVLAEAVAPEAVPIAQRQLRAVLMQRHENQEDFTLMTQDAMLKTFGAVIDALTAGLAGIAAISLAVAGIGIMNVMLVSVSERTREVGLLKALGARRRQILEVFLAEALMLSGGGAAIGIGGGVIAVLIAAAVWTFIPLKPNPGWILLVLALAIVAGVSFGLMPARRAARLHAADALRGKQG
ncbi:MAG: ABC transporter permease [Candidatus Eisenbacteria bacterium]|uniref:ABC transporter permease n=1 Tax=Eiseniibacteriota bacterium TaxID=2212470 RepID=A0A9D6L7L1_UNCEI|nr:ABC transporter permease [Candidatus Eisenbacteria bacterium]MBI3539329.1 ABC transporter permease [Candidatus Eisenbacteria bacterium]